jgi:hypothetical protein
MNDSSLNHARMQEGRKPYEKPSYRYEKVFVTSALSCGKIGTTSLGCSGNQKVS